jgi:hypothetical protein
MAFRSRCSSGVCLVTDARDAAQAGLVGVCDGVRDALPGSGFVRDGTALIRTTDSGITQVVYMYWAPVGSPFDTVQVKDAFQVQLGARVDGIDGPYKAFPIEFGLDVSISLGETRRHGWDPHWNLSSSDHAIQEIASLLSKSGQRWFDHVHGVDRMLVFLASRAPNDTSKTWTQPRLVAMQIHALRGELVEAQRALEEHLVQPNMFSDRDLPYAVIRARAAALGLPTPVGEEPFLQLGRTWLTAYALAHDLETTTGQEARLGAHFDVSRSAAVLNHGDASLTVGGIGESDIGLEVTEFLQRRFTDVVGQPWPRCPGHEVQLQASQEASGLAWHCAVAGHLVARVGQLQQTDRTACLPSDDPTSG